jgi:hypothetical protein
MRRWADLDLEPHVPGRQRTGDRDLRDRPSSNGSSNRLHGASCCRRSLRSSVAEVGGEGGRQKRSTLVLEIAWARPNSISQRAERTGVHFAPLQAQGSRERACKRVMKDRSRGKGAVGYDTVSLIQHLVTVRPRPRAPQRRSRCLRERRQWRA